MNTRSVALIVGTRPNFVKAAPLMRELLNREAASPDTALSPILIHTGQHYDKELSDLIFNQLGMPKPDVNLEVGSGSHAVQTAEIMSRLEAELEERRPGAVVTFGDVNSTLAASVVCSKLNFGLRGDDVIRPLLVHVEAGLRSFDRDMPEEVNRLVADSLSDLLFTTSPEAHDNLQNEGVPAERIHFVGNIMIDSLYSILPNLEKSHSLMPGLASGNFVLVTIHRPENTDRPHKFREIINALDTLGEEIDVVFPVHPRTKAKMGDDALNLNHLQLTKPLGYTEFLHHMNHARLVITDSGGVQEETTILGVPCITVRKNTERPITITVGTNELVSAEGPAILEMAHSAIRGDWKKGASPDLWDGKTAGRIVEVLENKLLG